MDLLSPLTRTYATSASFAISMNVSNKVVTCSAFIRESNPLFLPVNCLCIKCNGIGISDTSDGNCELSAIAAMNVCCCCVREYVLFSDSVGYDAAVPGEKFGAISIHSSMDHM